MRIMSHFSAMKSYNTLVLLQKFIIKSIGYYKVLESIDKNNQKGGVVINKRALGLYISISIRFLKMDFIRMHCA